MTLLIEDFEERHYTLKPASPIEHIVELMAAHDLKQKDLVDIFGTPSIVSCEYFIHAGNNGQDTLPGVQTECASSGLQPAGAQR